MATGSTTDPNPKLGALDVQENDFDRFILQQIERTQRQVKITELATLLLMLGVGVLGFFLIVSLIDHWIIGLGFYGRLTALLVLVTSSVVFIATQVIPYVLRSINPVYAAQAIEKSTPNAKNGLINFMLLRNRPDEIRPAVFDAVQKRAAVDLSDVEVDLAIDRTLMIRLGYAFAALVAFAGAYMIFSPKDPVTTVSRVISPWEQIARPSSVQIDAIRPGDVTVYRGQTVDVTASVLGTSGTDQVTVVYSTEDGQIIDAEVLMQNEGGSLYSATLGGTSGMQHDSVYRLRAGDAESIEYRITVKEAPSIDVTRVDYDFAAYTEIPSETTNVGDVRAVEGTRITIHAESNQPIASAFLELLPGNQVESNESPHPTQFRPLRMKHSGQSATATLTLQLQADRSTPEFSNYRVRFSNDAGEKNDQPVLHDIEATPDLVPLVEILSPETRDIKIPANRFVDFEIRGVDPDFKLSALGVEAASNGATILSTNLISEHQSGQVVQKYRFQPNSFGLEPGSSVLLWGTAADNRHSPKNGQTDPNLARTENYRIRITAPESVEPDPDNPDPDNKEQPNEPSNDSSNSEDQSGEAGDGSGGLNSNETSDGTSGESTDQQGTGSSADDSEESGDDDSSSDPSDGGSSSDAANDSDPGSTSEGTTDGSQSDRDSTTPENNEQSTTSDDGNGSQPSEEGTEEQPVASDGTNDPDAFERILDHMREKEGETKNESTNDDNSSSSDTPSNASNEESSDNKDSKGNDGEPRSGDSSSSDSEDSNDTDDGNASNDDNSKSSPPKGSTDNLDENRDSNSEEASSDESERGANDDKSEIGTPSDGGEEPESDGDSTNDSSETPSSNDSTTPDNSKPSNAEDSSADGTTSDSADGDPKRTQDDPSDNGQNGPSEENPRQDPLQEGAQESAESAETDTSNESGSTQQSNDETQGPSDANTDATKSESNEELNSNNGNDNSSTTPNGQTDSTDSAREPQDNSSNSQPGPDKQGSKDQEIAGQDDPNLEYARKATDMALEYLKDQKDNRELLDSLGWTKEEADAFLQRWRNLQQESANPNRSNRGQREWNDALKSLGLKPRMTKSRSGANQRRDQRSVSSDSGRRSKPPAAYADQFRAYLKESENAE